MKKVLSAILCAGLPKKDIKNANRVNLWAIAWVITLGLTMHLLNYEWFNGLPYLIPALLIHLVVGIAMVFAFKTMLVHLDEMEKKIQLDALAMSVGAAIVIYSSWSILEKANMFPELQPAYLIGVIGLTYMVGLMSGRVRYS